MQAGGVQPKLEQFQLFQQWKDPIALMASAFSSSALFGHLEAIVVVDSNLRASPGILIKILVVEPPYMAP